MIERYTLPKWVRYGTRKPLSENADVEICL